MPEPSDIQDIHDGDVPDVVIAANNAVLRALLPTSAQKAAFGSGTSGTSGTSLTVEDVQDIVGAMFGASGANGTYNDAAGTYSIAVAGGLTQEQVEDFVANEIIVSAGLTATYADNGDGHGTLTIASTAGTPGVPTRINGRNVLTDAATVAVDAAYSYSSLILTPAVGNTRLIANPANLADGDRIYIEITQPATGANLAVTWDTLYSWTVDVPLVVLSQGNGKSTFTGFLFNATRNKLVAQSANHEA